MTDAPTVEDIERAVQQRDRLVIARQMAAEWALGERLAMCPQAVQHGIFRPDRRRIAPGCSYCGMAVSLAGFSR